MELPPPTALPGGLPGVYLSLIPPPVAALPCIEPGRCSCVNHNYSAKPCVQAARNGDWPSPASKKLRGPPWRFPHTLAPYRDPVRENALPGAAT